MRRKAEVPQDERVYRLGQFSELPDGSIEDNYWRDEKAEADLKLAQMVRRMPANSMLERQDYGWRVEWVDQRTKRIKACLGYLTPEAALEEMEKRESDAVQD